jgi:4-hydroxy-2-oxoheptanedioate aldolase
MLGVKNKLARGETATMCLVNYTSPALVEQLARVGFDVAMIDCEKGNASPRDIEDMCRAGRSAGIACIVRGWSGDPGLLSRYLDLGADGVMVAAIETPQAAKALAESVRYARFKDWQDKLVIGMLESPKAIADLPNLLAVEGIDVWFIGPNDLAHRMGMPGQGQHQAVWDLAESALRTIHAAGKIGGILAPKGRVPSLQAAGARLLLARSSELLATGAQEFHSQLTPSDKGSRP